MLSVENLNKRYENFSLKNVSFDIEAGYILGFIGINGAGKSTTIKSLLDIVKADSGKIKFFGKDLSQNELEIKQKVGISLGSFDYYPRCKLSKISAVYKEFFNTWNAEKYAYYVKKFKLDENKRVKELSQGMKVKFSLALAISHDSKLLILDEPTSGLDPLAREEILDIFQEIVEDGKHSILFSTHITSDLDKCADYILFIKNGEIVDFDTKDDLITKHVLVSGNADELDYNVKSRVIAYKQNAYNFKALALRENIKDFNFFQETPNIEDIILFYNKQNNL